MGVAEQLADMDRRARGRATGIGTLAARRAAARESETARRRAARREQVRAYVITRTAAGTWRGIGAGALDLRMEAKLFRALLRELVASGELAVPPPARPTRTEAEIEADVEALVRGRLDAGLPGPARKEVLGSVRGDTNRVAAAWRRVLARLGRPAPRSYATGGADEFGPIEAAARAVDADRAASGLPPLGFKEALPAIRRRGISASEEAIRLAVHRARGTTPRGRHAEAPPVAARRKRPAPTGVDRERIEGLARERARAAWGPETVAWADRAGRAIA